MMPKFRAWDKRDEQMKDVLGISFHHKTISVDNGRGRFLQDKWDNFKAMQSTGLKDKHGVEIYEGDIIEGELFEGLYQVVYDKAANLGANGGEYGYWVTGFIPAYMDGTFDEMGDCEFMYSEMIEGSSEVKGNIYEHPHLLEGAEK